MDSDIIHLKQLISDLIAENESLKEKLTSFEMTSKQDIRINDIIHTEYSYNRSLIEASADPFFAIDPRGIITDVNNATVWITGLMREDLVGTDFAIYFTEHEKARACFREAIVEGAILNFPLEITNKDNDITSVLFNATVYWDNDGNAIGVFAAARDITEINRIEQALRLANNYNRSLIEAIADPLFSIDSSGRVSDVNTATEWVTGYHRADLIGSYFSKYFTEPVKAQNCLEEAYIEGAVLDFPLEMCHVDGGTISVLFNATVYWDDSGKVIGVLGAARDISERKKSEEALRKSEHRLNELNATKDKFFSIIAHDLRNPLGNFKEATKVLFESYDDFTNEDRLEFLGLMKNSANNIYSLLENLLEWSRTQQGTLNFNPICIDLKLIAEDNIQLLKLSAEKKKINLQNNISDSIQTIADPNLISTVIRNLLSNAIKFTPDNGVITIEAIEEENYIRISVNDSGVGMSQDTIDKLFRIDINITTLGTSQEKGTGLGLILCKEFLNKHGGKIWVESEVDKGSKFIFTLPKSRL